MQVVRARCGTMARPGSVELAADRVPPVVEDPSEVRLDNCLVRKLAEWTKRQPIKHEVAHQRSICVLLEGVLVLPVAVRPARLPVDEPVARRPLHDLGLPVQPRPRRRSS